jgi:pimeloyl-ACP methyl ester carboxylesterase
MADVAWELRESGPSDAKHTVLLLPGGCCSARTYKELMDEPALSGMRLVAATLPGHAGAPPLQDPSIENTARVAAELAEKVGADVLVGYSMGATVAYEMVVSKAFTGPTVLIGISLSAEDEAGFFLRMVKLGSVFGSLPSKILSTGAAAMVKKDTASPERRRELKADFKKNVPRENQPALRLYVDYLYQQKRPAELLCETGVRTWTAHSAEKSDGGLTDAERATLEACATTKVITIPGASFFIPFERSAACAEIIAEASATLA